MDILLNDSKIIFDREISLHELLMHQDIQDAGIAVAVNYQVVPRIQWKDFILKEKDSVLVIKAAQGG